MSLAGGSLSFGSAAGGASRSTNNRGRISNAARGVNYPSPFFDVAHTYLPTTVKAMFRWCRYYFLTNPLINATVVKMAEYPVTDLIVDHKDREVKQKWEEFLQDTMRIRPRQIECNLDYQCYGNSMTSLGFPFRKYLKCSNCGMSERADKLRLHWLFTNNAFRLSCPKCGVTAEARATDIYYKNAAGINLIRWNCEHVDIKYNDLTGEHTYFYNIPRSVRNDITVGNKTAVEGIPQVFIQAMQMNRGVVFSKDNFFHMKRPTLAQADRGWGTPLQMPVLKDTFYLQLMKKSQEAILLEHIVPLRILFPQAGSGSSDPYCVSPGTLVETSAGLRPAEEVSQGDYLRSHTGGWRRVIAQKRRKVGGAEDVYKVSVASLAGVPFEVSEEHPILAVPKTGRRERQQWVDPEFIPVSELKEGDYVAYPTTRARSSVGEHLDLKDHLPERAHTDQYTYLNISQSAAEAYEYLEARDGLIQKAVADLVATHADGEVIDLVRARGWRREDYNTAYSMRSQPVVERVPRHMHITESLARLVGYYLAEGSRKGTLVSLAFHEDEHELHADVASCVLALGFDKVTSVHSASKVRGVEVVVNSVILSGLLMSMCGTGFATKRIPQELAESSDSCALSMLYGLFAGDGCDFSTSTNRVALKLANPSMILEARRLLLSFGVIGGVMSEPPTETSLHKTTSYALNFNGKAAEAVRSLLLGNTNVTVGWQKNGVFRGGYVLMPIRKLEKVDDVPEVIGFQMAVDKSFCVAGVATHNTTIDLSTWRDHVAEEVARWRIDCVAQDSWVETSEGLERARNIKEGDLVKNHQGSYSRVQGAVTRPLREGEQVYRVHARGLSAVTTELSETHPVWAARKVNNGNGHKLGMPEMIEVQSLCPGDYVGYPCTRAQSGPTSIDLGVCTSRAATEKYVYVDHTGTDVPEAYEYLESAETPESRAELLESRGWGLNAYKIAQNAIKQDRVLRRLPRAIPFSDDLAWVLGVYTAEGSTTSKQVAFALHNEETGTLDRLTRVMREVFNVSDPVVSEKSEHGIQATFSSTVAVEFFANEVPGVSTSKPLSALVRGGSDAQVRAFLNGYIAGDGCWHEDGVTNKTDWSTSSLQLAESLRQLLLSLMVPVGLSSIPGERRYFPAWDKWVDVSTSYKLTISGANNTRFRAWLTGKEELGAAASCQMGVFADGWFWYRIQSVERVEGSPVVAIQTEQESASAEVSDGSRHGTFCVWGYATANCNYIPIMPLPLGQQTVGGDGRALMLTPEMQALSDQIIAGMGAPREFIYGGLTYSGSNVSMRMLENSFINNILRQKQMVNWIVQEIGAYMDWPIPQIRFKPFKMADDIQRKAYLFQLNQAQKISDTTLLADSDLDQNSEDELMVKETANRLEATKKQQLAMAAIQGEAQVVMAKSQAKAQQVAQDAQSQGVAPGEPGAPGVLPQGMESPLAASQDMAGEMQPGQQGAAPPAQQPGMSIEALAESLAHQLVQLGPEEQQMALDNLKAQSPELAQMVEQLANQLQQQPQQQPGQGQAPSMGMAGQAANQVNMQPLPEQLPPRRMAASV